MSDTTQTATVTVYSTPTCAFCKTEKQWLESLGVSYINRDIEVEEGARDELLAHVDGDFRGVPTTVIGDEIIVGFDRPKLTEALKKHALVTA